MGGGWKQAQRVAGAEYDGSGSVGAHGVVEQPFYPTDVVDNCDYVRMIHKKRTIFEYKKLTHPTFSS